MSSYTQEEENLKIQSMMDSLQIQGIIGNYEMEQELLALQGYGNCSLKMIERVDSENKSYKVYKDKNEFVTIVADTAVDALNESGLDSVYKIVHSNCRFPAVLKQKDARIVKQEIAENIKNDEQVEQSANNEEPQQEQPSE